MDFSSPLSTDGGVCWSPCGQLLATCAPPRITVWAAASLQVAAVLPCQDLPAVDRILFSPDSQLLLAAGFKAGVVLVYSVGAAEWRGRVTTGAGGLMGVLWGGDSRHLLTLGDWGVLLTVWSLASKSIQYIKTPKQWSCQGELGNRDGSYSAVVERRDCRDCLNIFTGSDWQLVRCRGNYKYHLHKSFRHTLLDTEDCAGALWAPHRDCIALWDTPLYYRSGKSDLSKEKI
jgi:WD40 repeat protein